MNEEQKADIERRIEDLQTRLTTVEKHYQELLYEIEKIRQNLRDAHII